MLFTINVFTNDDLFIEYNFLYNDLINFETPGYKSSWDANNFKGNDIINISQGRLIQTEINSNIAIIGEGYFKIKLDNDLIGYTRAGNFHLGLINTFLTLVNINGFMLYDTIIIPTNTIDLFLDDNKLYALLSDGTRHDAGTINIYLVNQDILVRKNGIFITEENLNSLEYAADSRIVSGFIESSNVNVIETLLRMHTILWELKNNNYNFDDKIQIILMLINNIPILNELSSIQNRIHYSSPFCEFSGNLLLRQSLNFLRLSSINNNVLEGI